MRRALLLQVLILCFIAFAASEASAQTCGTPGKDGAGGSLTGIVNTYYPGNATVNAGSTTITLGAPLGAATTITTGDLMLVVQMQDAAINSTNSSAYGDNVSGDPGAGASAINNSGMYEYVVATSNATTMVNIRGLGTNNGLLNTYTNANAGTSQGQRRFQVVRVPQYLSATLTSGLTAMTWNGRTGGILAIDVSGALNLGGALVSVDGLGFRGGGARQVSGDNGGANTDYRNTTINTCHGIKGEGIAGTPRYVYDPATLSVIDNATEGYPNGATARGAPGNAGGGGTDGNPIANDQNSGGGGGGNGGVGGMGGNTWSSNLARGGFGGDGVAGSANRLVMGGGGGAGSRNNSSGVMSSGGSGGGVVLIRAGSISGSGTITANGSAGISAENDGGGGGGAGGSIMVVAVNSSLGSLSVQAKGGKGGDAWITQTAGGTPGNRHGPGGGGAGGVVVLSGSASVNVSGGSYGTTTTSFDSYGATAGGTGLTISATISQIPGASAGASCSPYVSLNKSVSPNGTQLPGTDLTYTINFTNTGGNSARTLVITDPDPSNATLSLNANTYFKVGSVTFAPGTSGLTLPTASITYSNNNGSTFAYTPVSGGGGAPAGYDANVTHIRLSFTGNLSQTSPNNTASISFKVRIK
jgi:uncharacterized repeat protein (TIGR01451 family)